MHKLIKALLIAALLIGGGVATVMIVSDGSERGVMD